MKLYYYLISIFCKHEYCDIKYFAESKYRNYKGKYKLKWTIYEVSTCIKCKVELHKYKIKSNQSEYKVKQFFNNLKDEEIH